MIQRTYLTCSNSESHWERKEMWLTLILETTKIQHYDLSISQDTSALTKRGIAATFESQGETEMDGISETRRVVWL